MLLRPTTNPNTVLTFVPDSVNICVSQKNLVFYVLPTHWA
jgi:hypothetical protein